MGVIAGRLGSTVPIWDRARHPTAAHGAPAWVSARTTLECPRQRHRLLRLSKTSYYPGDNIVKLVLSHLKHQSTKNRKRVPDGLSTALDRGIFLVTESLRSEFPPLRVHRTTEVSIWRSGMHQYFLRSWSFSCGLTNSKPYFS